jgi:signal transduction histidine kinase
MSADDLIKYLSWFVYIVIFVQTAATAIRRPLRTNIDIVLFFTVSTVIVALSVAGAVGILPQNNTFVGSLTGGLLLSLAYMSMRLVDDFSDVPAWLMRLAAGGLAVCVIGTFALAPHTPIGFVLLEVMYLIGFLLYGVAAFIRESRLSNGVTQRRMRLAAAGSIWLCVDLLFIVVALVAPIWPGFWLSLSDVAGLASGICYFLGFAPPGLLRRAWQEPELRRFLSRAAQLPRLPDTPAILREMERGAATSLGAPHATVGLWDADNETMQFTYDGEAAHFTMTPATTTGKAFLTQQPVFTPQIDLKNPAYAGQRRPHDALAVLAAPITAGDKRLGVLVVYAPKTPVFAEDDLALVQLLADQAAVVLESRALIDEAARVRAREEVTRLKEDFLSAAAHDLKTPLTTLVAQAQLLERRAVRAPAAPADVEGIRRLVREAQRLKTLVLELLDAARAEQGRLVGQREDVDLVALVQEICARHTSPRHPCIVDGPRSVAGVYDPVRIMQLVENLVENAVKYSPEGGAVRVKVWREDGYNNLTVTDSGIGIPSEDLPHIFERFHRGTNVDDRRFAGMGLGLFICRGIAEQHGGRIWVTRAPGGGSTFHVALPAAAPQDGTRQGGAPNLAAVPVGAPRDGTGQGDATHD